MNGQVNEDDCAADADAHALVEPAAAPTMTFRERFIRARALMMGITTLAALADRVGVQYKTLRGWLDRARRPRAVRVKRLAAVLDIDATALAKLLDQPDADHEVSP